MSKIPVKEPITPTPRPAVNSMNLEILQDAALAHLKSSKINLLILRDLSRGDHYKYDAYKCVKEGSYFLCYADQIIQIYKTYTNGKIYDKNIKKIEDTLKKLEFSSKHLGDGYTMENHDGQVRGFLSKGQGAKYYQMLHGSENGVKDFIKIVEKNINGPVQNFLNELSDKEAASRILKTFTRDYIRKNFKDVDFAVEAKEEKEESVKIIKEDKEISKTNIFTNNVVMFFSILGILIGEVVRRYNIEN